MQGTEFIMSKQQLISCLLTLALVDDTSEGDTFLRQHFTWLARLQ